MKIQFDPEKNEWDLPEEELQTALVKHTDLQRQLAIKRSFALKTLTIVCSFIVSGIAIAHSTAAGLLFFIISVWLASSALEKNRHCG